MEAIIKEMETAARVKELTGNTLERPKKERTCLRCAVKFTPLHRGNYTCEVCSRWNATQSKRSESNVWIMRDDTKYIGKF